MMNTVTMRPLRDVGERSRIGKGFQGVPVTANEMLARTGLREVARGSAAGSSDGSAETVHLSGMLRHRV